MEEILEKQKERKEIHKKFKKKRIENQELKTLFARIHRINNELNKESGNLNPTNYTTRIQSVRKLREKKNQIQKEIIKIYNANKIQQKIYQNDSTTRSTTKHPRKKNKQQNKRTEKQNKKEKDERNTLIKELEELIGIKIIIAPENSKQQQEKPNEINTDDLEKQHQNNLYPENGNHSEWGEFKNGSQQNYYSKWEEIT